MGLLLFRFGWHLLLKAFSYSTFLKVTKAASFSPGLKCIFLFPLSMSVKVKINSDVITKRKKWLCCPNQIQSIQSSALSSSEAGKPLAFSGVDAWCSCLILHLWIIFSQPASAVLSGVMSYLVPSNCSCQHLLLWLLWFFCQSSHLRSRL